MHASFPLLHSFVPEILQLHKCPKCTAMRRSHATRSSFLIPTKFLQAPSPRPQQEILVILLTRGSTYTYCLPDSSCAARSSIPDLPFKCKSDIARIGDRIVKVLFTPRKRDALGLIKASRVPRFEAFNGAGW